jgi:hypothetical protein
MPGQDGSLAQLKDPSIRSRALTDADLTKYVAILAGRAPAYQDGGKCTGTAEQAGGSRSDPQMEASNRLGEISVTPVPMIAVSGFLLASQARLLR